MLFFNGRRQEGILSPALTFAGTLTHNSHAHPLWDFHASSGHSLGGVYEFNRTAETKGPRPRDSNDTNLVFHSWGGWESKVKVLVEVVPPKHRCGGTHSRPACLLGLKMMDGFSLHLHCPHHYRSVSQFPLLVILSEGPL